VSINNIRFKKLGHHWPRRHCMSKLDFKKMINIYYLILFERKKCDGFLKKKKMN